MQLNLQHQSNNINSKMFIIVINFIYDKIKVSEIKTMNKQPCT